MGLTITKADVIAIAGELDGKLNDTQWGIVLADTALEVSVGKYPSQAKADATAKWLAAHKAFRMWKASTPAGGGSTPAGPLSSVTVGPISKTFAAGGVSPLTSSPSDELKLTSYGREYLRLLRLFAPRAFVAL